MLSLWPFYFSLWMLRSWRHLMSPLCLHCFEPTRRQKWFFIKIHTSFVPCTAYQVEQGQLLLSLSLVILSEKLGGPGWEHTPQRPWRLCGNPLDKSQLGRPENHGTFYTRLLFHFPFSNLSFENFAQRDLIIYTPSLNSSYAIIHTHTYTHTLHSWMCGFRWSMGSGTKLLTKNSPSPRSYDLIIAPQSTSLLRSRWVAKATAYLVSLKLLRFFFLFVSNFQ